jgi:membrane protein YdbS with pleckstrin-like domain
MVKDVDFHPGVATADQRAAPWYAGITIVCLVAVAWGTGIFIVDQELAGWLYNLATVVVGVGLVVTIYCRIRPRMLRYQMWTR